MTKSIAQLPRQKENVNRAAAGAAGSEAVGTGAPRAAGNSTVVQDLAAIRIVTSQQHLIETLKRSTGTSDMILYVVTNS